jgi:hypothetical protein
MHRPYAATLGPGVDKGLIVTVKLKRPKQGG